MFVCLSGNKASPHDLSVCMFVCLSGNKASPHELSVCMFVCLSGNKASPHDLSVYMFVCQGARLVHTILVCACLSVCLGLWTQFPSILMATALEEGLPTVLWRYIYLCDSHEQHKCPVVFRMLWMSTKCSLVMWVYYTTGVGCQNEYLMVYLCGSYPLYRLVTSLLQPRYIPYRIM